METEAEIRAQIAELNRLRGETTDPERREDLGDAISAIGMSWQFRKAEAERETEEAGKPV